MIYFKHLNFSDIQFRISNSTKLYICQLCMKGEPRMKFQHKDILDTFLNEINQHLINEKNRVPVAFSSKNVSPWDGGKLSDENETLLANTSGKANVYMLFTAKKGSKDYKLRYIGKTTRKLARQRLRNRLFKKNDGTGAKLEAVMSHVKAGGSMKISWVTVEPESLRNWAEEELISAHPEANWNRENA